MFYDFINKRDRTKIGSWNANRHHAKRLQILTKTGSLRGKVLEIGPGKGALAYQCREAGVEYFGLERSPALRDILVKEGFNITYGIAPPLPFKDSQFDLVCAMAVLEHMATFEKALALLEECNRVLKADGTLVLLVPDYRICGIDFFNWDYSHSFVTTPYRVRMILIDTGFEVHHTVHFSGGFTGLMRWPIDVISLFVNTRLIYWIMASIGMELTLFKYHKTFEPAFLMVSKKVQELN